MSKPRVILADSDVNYVIPLQARFIEEFSDSIDLEIITDEQYLHELFLNPQNVFLLIVSERMYEESFTKHGIDYLYILTESVEGEESDDIAVERIFKYTSVKEIFNRIVSTCFRDAGQRVTDTKVTKVIAICAGKGGTGKTTVALGMAAHLAQNYKRVLYINVSELQSYQAYMENVLPISDAEVYIKLRTGEYSCYNEMKSYIRKEGFYYLPPLKAPLFSIGLGFSVYVNFIKEAQKSVEYDYIVVDVDTGFDENMMNLLDSADKAIFVMEQNYASVLATNRVAENIGGVGTDKYIFVCNKFDRTRKNYLVESGVNLKYTIATYIDYASNIDEMCAADFVTIKGIDKLAYHII